MARGYFLFGPLPAYRFEPDLQSNVSVQGSTPVGIRTYTGNYGWTSDRAPGQLTTSVGNVLVLPLGDDFNRADSIVDLVPVATGPMGGWSWLPDSLAYGALKVVSNQLTNTTVVTGTSYKTPDLGTQDQFVEFVSPAVTNSTGTFFCCRLQDSNNFIGIRAGFGAANGQVEIYRRAAGTLTDIGSTSSNFYTAGDTIKLVVAGTQFYGYKNGIQFVKGAHGSSASSTQAGIVARSTAVVVGDSFRAGRAGDVGGQTLSLFTGGVTVTLPSTGAVTVNVTGQSVTASVGIVIYPVTGQSITASVGTATVSLPVSTTVTGQSATADTTTSTVVGKANVTVTGQSVAVTLGAVNLPVTGQQLATSVGDVTVSTPAGAVNVSVNVTGQSTAVSVGIVDFPVIGQSITASVNGVTVVGKAGVNVTGQSVTVTLGTVNLPLTGQTVSVSVGNVSVVGKASVSVTQGQLATSLGVVTVNLASNLSVGGQALTASVGNVSITAGGAISTGVGGQQVTVDPGTVTVVAVQNLSVGATGQFATVSVGSVTVAVGTGTSVAATGLSATVSLGAVTVNAAQNVSTTVTGQALNTAVGTVSVTVGGNLSVTLTGLSVTASVGTVVQGFSVSTAVTGQSVTASVGTARGRIPALTTPWNPAQSSSFVAFSNNNLTVTESSSVGGAARSLVTHLIGKYYFEVTINNAGGLISVGVTTDQGSGEGTVLRNDGGVQVNDSVVGTQFTYTTGDVIGVSVDFDSHQIVFTKNGGSATPAYSLFTGASYARCYVFLSQATLETGFFNPPSGYLEWGQNFAVVRVGGQSLTVSGGAAASFVRCDVFAQGCLLFAPASSVTVSAGISVAVTGQSLAISVGTVVAGQKLTIPVSAPQLTVSAGTVSIGTGIRFGVTGVELVAGTAYVFDVISQVRTTVTGNVSTVQIGSATASGQAIALTNGFSLQTQLGVVDLKLDFNILSLNGLMLASVGRVVIYGWGVISDPNRDQWTPDLPDAVEPWTPVEHDDRHFWN